MNEMRLTRLVRNRFTVRFTNNNHLDMLIINLLDLLIIRSEINLAG